MSQELARDFVDLPTALAILRRQWRLVAGIIFLGLTLAIAYLFVVVDEYRATALVFVEPTPQNIFEPNGAQSGNIGTINARVESEAALLKSDANLLATVSLLNLPRHPGFAPRPGLLDRIKSALGADSGEVVSGQTLLSGMISRLSNQIDVRRRGLTLLIEISARSEDPELAALIANGVAQAHIENELMTRTTRFQESGDILRSQLSSARARLQETEASFADFVTTLSPRLAELGNPRLIELSQSFEQANRSHDALMMRVNSAQGAYQRKDWDTLAAMFERETFDALIEQREFLTREPESGAIVLTPEQIALAIADIEQKIAAEATVSLSVLRDDQAAASMALDAAREGLNAALGGTELPPQLVAELFELQQESDIAQQQYASILGRLRTIEAQTVTQVASLRLASEALVPTVPSAPKKRFILAAAFVAACAFGVVLALTREFYLGGVNSGDQLANLHPGVVAGVLPKVLPEDQSQSVADQIVTAPYGALAEATRKLRLAIDRIPAQTADKGKVVAVTSSLSQEGKTSLSLALARSYSLSGLSVILIDTDLRLPRLHHHLGLEPQAGLIDYLRAPEQFEKSGSETFNTVDPKSETTVILGRALDEVPVDPCLSSTVYRDLVEKAAREFDVVILDTAPLLPVVDTRYFLPLADVILNCVRYEKTATRDLREGIAILQTGKRPGAEILSAMTFFPEMSEGYGYYKPNI